MRLLKLTLQNFQGMKHFEFNPAGHNAGIYGTNASGKTTTYNAMTWLLFDKASTGEKGFTPKTKDENGADKHNLEHAVEGIFLQDDETEVIFRKVLRELWVKKRGSITENFDGNTVDYFVDGVPVPKKEYDGRLAEIFTTEQAQVLTQPEFFSEAMSWQDRRKLLLEVCGSVTDEEVIAFNKELAELSEFLCKPGSSRQSYSVEEYQRIAGAKAKEINNRLEQIPSEIKGIDSVLQTMDVESESVLKKAIEKLQNEIQKQINEKASITENGATSAIYSAIADVQTKISEGRIAYVEDYEKQTNYERLRLYSLRMKLNELKNLDMYTGAIDAVRRNISDLKEQRQRLSAEYRITKSTEWNGEINCPACGQLLSADNLEAEKQKFNLYRAEKLERIRAEIEKTCSKDIIAKEEQELANNEKRLEELTAQVLFLQGEIDNITIPKMKPYEETQEYAYRQGQIDELREKIASGSNDTTGAKNALQAKIDGLQRDIDAQREKLATIKAQESMKTQIQVLQDEEKDCAKAYERIQYSIYLCETFIKTKVGMLDEKINGKFESVKFRLFDEQINGGIREDCTVMIPTDNGLVPFATANNAARINAGLEIIGTLSKHWKITIPCFIDNAESVVKLMDIPTQIIRLVVSEQDSKLRVEVEE